MATKSTGTKRRSSSTSSGTRSDSRRASSGRGTSSHNEDRDREQDYERRGSQSGSGRSLEYDQWNRPSRSGSDREREQYEDRGYGRESYQGQRGGRFSEEEPIREPYQEERRRGRSQNNYEEYDENMGRVDRRFQGRGSSWQQEGRRGSEMNEDIGGMRSRGYQDQDEDENEAYQNTLRRGSRDENMDEDEFEQPRRRQSRQQQDSRH